MRFGPPGPTGPPGVCSSLSAFYRFDMIYRQTAYICRSQSSGGSSLSRQSIQICASPVFRIYTFGAIWLGDCDSLQRNVFSLSILGFHPSYICLWPPSLLSIVHAIVLWSGQQPRNSAPLPPFLRESPQSDLAAAISKRRRSLNSTLRHLLIFFDISASGFCSYANILGFPSFLLSAPSPLARPSHDEPLCP